ncbi:serine hydrolase domain-containing protein, partial [Acinetobacter baumannii]
LDPARLASLKHRLHRASESGEVAGTVCVIVKRGRVVFHSADGYADLAARRPMARDTVFQVMSMTKPVVGVAVVQCAEA